MGYVDFDEDLHRTYAEGRRLSSDVLAMWAQAVASRVDASSIDHILDLGAGTGRFSSVLESALGAEVTAVDPSRNMLARIGRDVRRVAARAEDLPFGDGSFDLVFASMVIHHFESVTTAASEIARVLRPGASLLVRTCFADTLETPYHRFFPAVLDVERGLLPTRSDFVRTLETQGLVLREEVTLRQRMDAGLRDYAERIRQRAMSPFLLISDEQFTKGMALLDAAAAKETEPVPLFEEIDLLRFTTDG